MGYCKKEIEKNIYGGISIQFWNTCECSKLLSVEMQTIVFTTFLVLPRKRLLMSLKPRRNMETV